MSELKTNKIATNDTNNVAMDNSLNLKSYTTTQRDALTSAAGDIIYNSTTNKVEHYNGSAWASGTKVVSIEFLIVGAGGGGGKSGQHFLGLGGAGAGGFLASYNNEASGGGDSSLDALTCLADGSTTYTVTVGAGGTGGLSAGNEGGSSEFILVAFGGMPGAQRYQSLKDKYGASGGGGTAINGRGVGLPNQGFEGGNGNNFTGQNSNHAAGGGGGAGAVGAASSSGTGGAGGAGVASTITGSSVTYAGGGGGGGGTGGGGAGGTGGGGAGGGQANGSNGTANTGGGGGGSYGSTSVSRDGGNGGSGIVILRYPTADATIAVGSGLTSSSATSGSDTIVSFTAGTGTVTFS